MSSRKKASSGVSSKEVARTPSPKKLPDSKKTEEATTRKRGFLGWFLSGLFFPFWLVWLLLRAILVVLLFPFGGWRRKAQKDEAKPGEVEKKLEDLNSEEAAITERMEKRGKIWRAASRSLIVYSAGLEIVFAGVAFFLLRSSPVPSILGGHDPLPTGAAAWQQLLKHWLLALSPVLLIPAASSFIYSTLNKVFRARDKKDQAQLQKLREQQKSELEQLLNESSFKATLKILQKYGGKEAAAAGLLGAISGMVSPQSQSKSQFRRTPPPGKGQWASNQQQPNQYWQGQSPQTPSDPGFGRVNRTLVSQGNGGMAMPSTSVQEALEAAQEASSQGFPTALQAWNSSSQASGASPPDRNPFVGSGDILPASFEFPMMPGSGGDAKSNVSSGGLRRRSVYMQRTSDGSTTGADDGGGGGNSLRRRGRSMSISDIADINAAQEGAEGDQHTHETSPLEPIPSVEGGASGGSFLAGSPWAAHEGGPGFREGGLSQQAWMQQEQQRGGAVGQEGGSKPWWHRDGILGRLAGMLVGEDPTQCYALICRHCHAHNGLARMEDLDHLSYFCPRCNYFNQAPKAQSTTDTQKTQKTEGDIQDGTPGPGGTHPKEGSEDTARVEEVESPSLQGSDGDEALSKGGSAKRGGGSGRDAMEGDGVTRESAEEGTCAGEVPGVSKDTQEDDALRESPANGTGRRGRRGALRRKPGVQEANVSSSSGENSHSGVPPLKELGA